MGTAVSILDDLQDLKHLVETNLERCLDYGSDCPKTLRESMEYSLRAGGKRIRPIFVLLACEACGGDVEAAVPAACAVEMVHTYSLIHDDLPAMDNDDLRRGKPTNHIVFGEANAILAGDALLTNAFEVIATGIQPAETAIACCADLAGGAGSEGMVAGQVDDLLAEKLAENGNPVDLAQLEAIHRRKTGKLIAASLVMGGRIGCATEEQQDGLREYGISVGLAFQIADDLLDCRGDAAKVGKSLRKDQQQGKATYPGLLGIEESQRRAEQLIEHAQRSLLCFGERAARLDALARYIIERDQ